MALLTRKLLESMGIELPDSEYELLEEHFETTLEQRVIDEVVSELSLDQAEELSKMRDLGDEQVFAWVQANVRDFSQIVSDEVDILLGELAENSEAISDS